MEKRTKGYRTVYYVLLLSLIVFSCSKVDSISNSKSNGLESLRKPDLQSYTVESRSFSDQKYSGEVNLKKRGDVNHSSTSGNNPFDPRANSYRDGPGIIIQTKNPIVANGDLLFLYQKYKSQMFTIADQSMGLNIYPGAILDGRSLEGQFSPRMLTGISNHIRPITISTSMPVSGSAVAKTSLPRPIAEKTLYNAALTDLETQNPGEVGAASLIVELDTFRVYEELKTLYGYNKGIDAFLINSSTVKKGENHLITSVSAIKIKFFQHNFTIDVDVPNSHNELFDPTGLNLPAITGGVTPVYVKSVTYGRMGVMIIESTESSEKLYNAVYKQLGILKNLIGIDKHLTEEEKNIINSASIRVKYTGIGTDLAPLVSVSGVNGFIDVLQANTTYSKTSPGIPVAFQLAYLNSGHGLVEAPFQINYGPYQKPYVRIQYKNSSWESSSSSNPIFTDSDIYMSFYKDPAGTFPHDDVPIFVPYLYQRSYGSKSTSNWQGSWDEGKKTDILLLKNPTSNKLIENKRVFRYVKYGSDANTSRDYTRFDMAASENYHILPVQYDHYNAQRPFPYQMTP
ncbi:thiol-activated cytolysin family protein [Sphingobacterium faecium]|uniref:thiol-activated cytolysin family protein n=1 Tax=Sphingobacterium faecium TaxID=34087 RepID=UPI003DA2AAC2